MKSIVFSTDLILGLIFSTLLILFTLITFESETEEISISQFNFEANDIMNILSNVKAKEFLNISSSLKNSNLSINDLNQPILDLIGSFWFSGNKTLASNITKEIISNLTSKCFLFIIENETVYNKCNKELKKSTLAFQLASGYQIGKPIQGYIARAWLTKAIKNKTEIIPFYPSGSGWTGQKFELTKRFSLPSNIRIYNATLFLSIHFGTDKNNVQSGAGFVNLKINGNERKNNVIWLYLEQEGSGSEVTTTAYGYLDVTNLLNPGTNEIYLAILTPNYHSHLHPGFRLIVTYNLTQQISEGEQFFSKRYYFDNVVGRKGSWATLSFFVPENARNISAILNLNIKDVDDTYVSNRNTTDILIFINNNTPFFRDSPYSDCIRKSNYFCRRDIARTFDFVQKFNISDKVVKGTNVVSVYVNCCDINNNLYDYEWGSGSSSIYSDPVNDPLNSSFVEINYTLPEKLYSYGEIDITRELLFGGEPSNPKTFNYYISENRSRIIDSKVHVAQGFSYMINLTQKHPNGTTFKIFTSPAGRTVPEGVYVFPNTIGIGNNSINIRDFQPDGSTSPRNYILPWSSLEYTYLVKGLVGYGNVFPTLEDAINDAINRLVTSVGLEGISAADIQTDSQAVGGIQWMWGPALFKLIIGE